MATGAAVRNRTSIRFLAPPPSASSCETGLWRGPRGSATYDMGRAHTTIQACIFCIIVFIKILMLSYMPVCPAGKPLPLYHHRSHTKTQGRHLSEGERGACMMSCTRSPVRSVYQFTQGCLLLRCGIPVGFYARPSSSVSQGAAQCKGAWRRWLVRWRGQSWGPSTEPLLQLPASGRLRESAPCCASVSQRIF